MLISYVKQSMNISYYHMLTCKISINVIAKLVTIKVYRYLPNDFCCDDFTALNVWNKVHVNNGS